MTDFAPDPYGIADEDSPDVAFNLAAEAPLDDKRLWPEDTGTLPFDARCALLQDPTSTRSGTHRCGARSSTTARRWPRVWPICS